MPNRYEHLSLEELQSIQLSDEDKLVLVQNFFEVLQHNLTKVFTRYEKLELYTVSSLDLENRLIVSKINFFTQYVDKNHKTRLGNRLLEHLKEAEYNGVTDAPALNPNWPYLHLVWNGTPTVLTSDTTFKQFITDAFLPEILSIYEKVKLLKELTPNNVNHTNKPSHKI